MSDLTVVCWKWKSTAWRPDGYGAKHVNALERMLKAYLHIPYRLVCVTDDPKGVNCETYPLWDEPAVNVRDSEPNCYKRLKLFDPAMKDVFGEWVLSIDLDVLILDDISGLITFEDEFKIKEGKFCPYNGSMWLLKMGSRPEVWNDFDPENSPKVVRKNKMPNGRQWIGSDQAWISHRLPGEAVWTEEDGVAQFMRGLPENGVKPNTKIIFFPGKTNPWGGDMPMLNDRLFKEYKGWMK